MLNFILPAILWIFYIFPNSKQSKSTDEMSLFSHGSIHHLCSSPPSTQVFWLASVLCQSWDALFWTCVERTLCVCVCVVWSTGPGDHSHEQLTSLECVLIGLTPCASLSVSLITLLLRVGTHYKSRSPAKVQIYWGWKAWKGQTSVEYIYLRPAVLTKSVWVNSLDSGFISRNNYS